MLPAGAHADHGQVVGLLVPHKHLHAHIGFLQRMHEAGGSDGGSAYPLRCIDDKYSHKYIFRCKVTYYYPQKRSSPASNSILAFIFIKKSKKSILAALAFHIKVLPLQRLLKVEGSCLTTESNPASVAQLVRAHDC